MHVYVDEPTVLAEESGDWAFGEEIPIEPLEAGGSGMAVTREQLEAQEEDVKGTTFRLGVTDEPLLDLESSMVNHVAYPEEPEPEIFEPEPQAAEELPEPKLEPLPPKKKKGKKKRQPIFEDEPAFEVPPPPEDPLNFFDETPPRDNEWDVDIDDKRPHW